jgi:hypothetical protein
MSEYRLSARETGSTASRRQSGSPFGIVWGQVYGLSHRLVSQRAEEFLPQVRALGARAVRITFYWGQIEPANGVYQWDALAAFLEQLQPADEAWVALATSSGWATRRPSDLIPSSPAKDPDAYYRFVRAVVEHCRGRIQYWQMEFEVGRPFWSGTAHEYVEQLKVFSRAVKGADADAQIVLGGFLDEEYDSTIARSSARRQRPFAIRDILLNLVGWLLRRERLRLYTYLLRKGVGLFDVVDLHLYQNVYTIPASIAYFRRKMATFGPERPLFIGEYNGPPFTDFPENARHMPLIMKALSALADSLSARDPHKVAAQSDAERQAMMTLYRQMPALPPQTQMFMQGCAPDLAAKRDRVNCREIVMRNLLALSAGAQKTFCFNLAPELSGRPYQVLNLLFDKYKLMDYKDGALNAYTPSAVAFRRMTEMLAGMEGVRPLDVSGRPTLYLFEVRRNTRGPLLVAWERRDAFCGEDEPPTAFAWPWPTAHAQAIDALGEAIPTEVRQGVLHLSISLTPVFIESIEAA